MRNLSNLWKPAALVALLMAYPVQRAVGAEPAAKDQGVTNVEIPAFLAPMLIGNRLEQYAYITVALTPANREKMLAIREKMPFLRDAFLREVNKANIVKADDPKTVDTVALKARLLVRVNQILPKGSVSDLKFQSIQMTPIEPPT
jgi:flagellar basal body-associated protein FliL